MNTAIAFIGGYSLGAAVMAFLMLYRKPASECKTSDSKGGYYHV